MLLTVVGFRGTVDYLRTFRRHAVRTVIGYLIAVVVAKPLL